MSENFTCQIRIGGHASCARSPTTSALEIFLGGWRFGFRSPLFAGLVFAADPALADPAQGRPITPNITATSTSDKCPSADFETFLRAFANSPVLQRKYTYFPLAFGANDPNRIGEDDAFKTSRVKKFEKIPNYVPESGTVYPTDSQMKEGKLTSVITTIKNSKTGENVVPEQTITDPANVTVLITLPDTGVQVFYRFRRTPVCWFLYGISDRST
jgi:hypothetical protein